MRKQTWEQLINYLEQKCDFHRKHGQATWTCFGDLRFTKEYCEANKLDYGKIEAIVQATGGFCDCEVLFNSVEHLCMKQELPSIVVN